ncbi:MAG: SAV0927 family protein [Clostridia bacterium]
MNFEYLFDETEKPLTRYVTFVTKSNRYDFGLFHTQQFNGKSIVVSLQNLKAALICADDVSRSDCWIKKLEIALEDVEVVKEFFKNSLSPVDTLMAQY